MVNQVSFSIDSPQPRVQRGDGHVTMAGMWQGVYVGDGPLGKGLFAGRTFLKGELIGIFEGSVIDFAAAVAKGEKQCYPLQIAHNRYIDLSEPGCFANHSCEPNAGIMNDLELIAISEISKGTEIRYDYSTTMDEDFFTMPCRCGSLKCRGVVADFKRMSPESRTAYLKLGLVMDFIRCQYAQNITESPVAPINREHSVV